MKIEQILVLHLFNTKQLTLQGIGNFTLDPNISVPQENDKEIILPQNSVSFFYNPKATEDDALINTIVQNTKKIKPLASADLDSYLMLGRQFLNIGKPFTMDGLGTLDKTQAGDLVFIPGVFITPKINAPKALKANEGEEVSGLFQDHSRQRETDYGKIIVIAITILVLLLGGWAIWHFVIQNPSKKEATPIVSTAPLSDSVTKAKDSVSIKKPLISVPDNGFSFKIIFKVTSNKDVALKSMEKMKSYGHKVIMEVTSDSMYKLSEPFKLPLSDTTRIKDSLNKYYYSGKGFVEL